MFIETIISEEINALPLPAFDGEVIVIDSNEDQRDAAAYLSEQQVIGFDTESRAAFKKGIKNSISLVQLSGAEKTYLIRIHETGLSNEILHILNSERILKVGAAIKDDIHGMREVSYFKPQGFVDLQTIVRDYGIRELSLKKIAAIVLGVRLSKAQRLSNWNARVLTPAQTRYAAIDAWVCREIYFKLMESPKVYPPKMELSNQEGETGYPLIHL